MSSVTPERGRATSPRARMVGLNLVAWDKATNTNPKPWLRAINDIYALGVRRVTIVPYVLVDRDRGHLIEKSSFGLAAGPGNGIVRAAILSARGLGMSVGLKPMIEIDNSSGEGGIWRATLHFNRDMLGPFFDSYEAFILDMAALARTSGATRFYIGSELAGLTGDTAADPYWRRLIAACRGVLSRSDCLLTYAANYSEYLNFRFWAALDEIGIDAYFPLAMKDEAQGLGAPLAEQIARSWPPILSQLRALSKQTGRRIMLAEWGVVPFDQTTVEPSEEEPSSTQDLAEALNAYSATLAAVMGETDWLAGIDLWHWSVSPVEDSNYRIVKNGPIANMVRDFVRG